MIDISVIDGYYIVQGPKLLLVLTKHEFIQCLRRGKWWKREHSLAQRLARAAAQPRGGTGNDDEERRRG